MNNVNNSLKDNRFSYDNYKTLVDNYTEIN